MGESRDTYFAGRPVGLWDRIGSVMIGYYPYGEEYTTTSQNKDKFVTYYRDDTTGLDYVCEMEVDPVDFRELTKSCRPKKNA